jgi:hypothetical protein
MSCQYQYFLFIIAYVSFLALFFVVIYKLLKSLWNMQDA